MALSVSMNSGDALRLWTRSCGAGLGRVPQCGRVGRWTYVRTCDHVLRITQLTELLADEPVIRRSIELRNPYVDPLNHLQVEILRKLRSVADGEISRAAELRTVMVLTINGIAAGLRNTG